MEDGSRGVDAQIPIEQDASSLQLSPTGMYTDPPPTYDHANGTATQGDETDQSTESSVASQWHQLETTTSVTTMTTTTSTTTIAHKPSKSKLRAKSKAKRPKPPSRRTTRSKSIDSFSSPYSNHRSPSYQEEENDPYLDALLARSVAALELSNSLLQSTIATKSTLSSMLDSEEELERHERTWERRLLEGRLGELRDGSLGKKVSEQLGLEIGSNTVDLTSPTEDGTPSGNDKGKKKLEWMEEIEGLVRDVEALFDDEQLDPDQSQRPAARGGKRSDGTGLVLGDPTTSTRSPPPRALTQYVSITGAPSGTTVGAGLGKHIRDQSSTGGGFAAESTADKYSILMPSTVGDKDAPHSHGHKERFVPSPSLHNLEVGPTGTWKSSKSGQSGGHSHLPSTSSTHSNSSLTQAQSRKRKDEPSLTRRITPPPTHPEALPLSTQEIMTLQLEQEKKEASNIPPSTSPREHLERYLRASTSASSTLSRASSSPVKKELLKTGHAQTPSTATFSSFGGGHEERSEHSHSTRSSLSSILSGRKPSLPRSPPSPSISAYRRSPGIRSPDLLSPPTSSRGLSPGGGIGGETPMDWYSPSLEAIPDHLEDEEVYVGYLSSDRERGRRHFRGRAPTLSPPSSTIFPSSLPNRPIQRPIPASPSSPSSRQASSSSNPSGRAITSSRFRTADTLRRILDTSPSPHSSRISIPSPGTSPTAPYSSHTHTNTNTRTNTDSSVTTITNMNAGPVLLSPPFHDHPFPHSPSGFSSTSDLHSVTSSDLRSSDNDRRTSKLLGRARPKPRFMPRTPSGMTAGLSVSGATARAPKMHAHVVVDEASPVVEVAFPENAIPEVIVPPPTAPISSVASNLESAEERRRTKSLSASVSSMLDQARAVEKNKVTRVKGSSNLKGSPAWRAERQLLNPNSAVTPEGASTPNEAVEAPSSTRTSWLMGLGLAITPSSSNASLVRGGGGGHSATPSVSGSIKSGVNTPPLRVSFAKEPVRYSEERERETQDDLDVGEEEAVEGEEGDGGLTIKARSLRRTSSWNDSISQPSSTRRRVPSKSSSKSKKEKEKKGGWLEWFVNATAAGNPNAHTHAAGMSGFGAISREEVYERHGGREDWA